MERLKTTSERIPSKKINETSEELLKLFGNQVPSKKDYNGINSTLKNFVEQCLKKITETLNTEGLDSNGTIIGIPEGTIPTREMIDIVANMLKKNGWNVEVIIHEKNMGGIGGGAFYKLS